MRLLTSLVASIAAAVALDGATAAPPTWARDVAPILDANCASCHRPGEIAPFSVLTHDDAVRRAAAIARAVERRAMPPWKPEPGHGDFLGVRRLSDRDIATIRAWARAGAPAGDLSQRPAPPAFPEGWQAGTPDETLLVSDSFAIEAHGQDQYRRFVVPSARTADRFIVTAEFRPGNRAVVHHAIVFLDATGTARTLDARAAGEGYPCFGGPGFAPTGLVAGWAPGALPPVRLADTATFLPASADVVVQVHYHPTGRVEHDRSSLGLTYGPAPRAGTAGVIVNTRRIDIPAGASNHVVRTDLTLPREVEVIGITPHAHHLGRDLRVTATHPDGRSQPLIWISDWDFNWQGQYTYREPVRLPKGTRIELVYRYDNSPANPNNPSDPPLRVTWGEGTHDEMAIAFLRVRLPSLADVPGFEREMRRLYLRRLLAEVDSIDELTRTLPGAAATRVTRWLGLADRDGDGRLSPQERDTVLAILDRRAPR